MIYHGNRIKIDDGASLEEGGAALEVLGTAGREIQRRHVETDPELAAVMAALPVNLGSSALPGTTSAD